MAWNGLSILNALAGGSRLTRQIAADLGTVSATLGKCLRTLRRKGLIASAEGVHQLTDAGRAALATGHELTSGPCNGQAVSRGFNTLRARAWRLIRMRDGFGVDDLLMTLCDGSEADAEGNLTGYMQVLDSAGYFIPMRKGPAGQMRWKLKSERDTGPEPPSWNKKTRILRDHNTGEVFTIPRKREARHAA